MYQLKNRFLQALKLHTPKSTEAREKLVAKHVVLNLNLSLGWGGEAEARALEAFWGLQSGNWFHISKISFNPYEPRVQELFDIVNPDELIAADAGPGEVPLKASVLPLVIRRSWHS